MTGCSLVHAQKGRPQREDQPQPLDECQIREDHQEDRVGDGDLQAELVAGQAADDNQDEHRDVDAQQFEDQAVQDDGSDHQEDDAPVELVDVRFMGFLGHRAKQHDGAQQSQNNA
ncbi:hypothetical protein G6F68_014210 [Rhizopus microsporus]|nr:hypothetical protein G6F68_014210 [Rhizopus microsporus]